MPDLFKLAEELILGLILFVATLAKMPFPKERSIASRKAIVNIAFLFSGVTNFLLAARPPKVNALTKKRKAERVASAGSSTLAESAAGAGIKRRMAPKEAKEINPTIAKIASKNAVFTT